MQYDIVDGGYLTWLYGSRPFARASWPPQSVRGAFLALDCLDDTFRLQRNPEYKANRKDKRFEDPNLYQQWQRIKQFRRDVIEDPRLTCIRIPGLEADDVIALLAWKFSRRTTLQLLAQDKDLLQIRGVQITDNQGNPVNLARFANRLPKAITREPLKRDQIPLILALMGDKSDNIPRLVGRGDLYIPAQLLRMNRNQAYQGAYEQYGVAFLKNLYDVVLPDPYIFDMNPIMAFEQLKSGGWNHELLALLPVEYQEEMSSWKEQTMHNRSKK